MKGNFRTSETGMKWHFFYLYLQAVARISSKLSSSGLATLEASCRGPMVLQQHRSLGNGHCGSVSACCTQIKESCSGFHWHFCKRSIWSARSACSPLAAISSAIMPGFY